MSRSLEESESINEIVLCQGDERKGRRSSQFESREDNVRQLQSGFESSSHVSNEAETLLAEANRLPLSVKPRKLFGGSFYQDKSECSAVISMVESKRRCWFENELRASRREWNHYKKWLRDSVREATRLDNLVRCSYEALDEYSKAVGAICADTYVNDDGKLLTKREQNRLEKRRANDSAEIGSGDGILLPCSNLCLSLFRC